jgi:hypothetical protein
MQQWRISRARSMPYLSSSSTISKPMLPTLPFASRRTFSWWWKRGGNDWTSQSDESFQQHMLRKQRILRYKYSKALRRKHLWDRDPSHNALRPTWGWRIPGFSDPVDAQNMSSKPSPGEASSSQKKTGQEDFDDFAHFKACIDKDPFAAVFGRRLISTQKPTDSSWSSFSWIFDATPPKESSKKFVEPAISNTPPTSKPRRIIPLNADTPPQPRQSQPEKQDQNTVSATQSPKAVRSEPDQKDEYEFDPISMRKVLKVKSVKEQTTKPRKPLFDPLFAEKGVDIPVKPYKPHRVYGYPSKSSSNISSSKDSASNGKVKSKAETPRLAEIRKLKAATLGNNIDTTAEYYGKWVPPDERAEAEANKTKSVMESSSDDTPLFSGTIYEGKSQSLLAGAEAPEANWLQREGFGTKEVSSVGAVEKGNLEIDQSPSSQSTVRIQPSLDRLQLNKQDSKKLEPSLDRFKVPRRKDSSPEAPPSTTQMESEEMQDLDLLRASDVRASMKSTRRTKQDSDVAKKDQRQKLENKFITRQHEDEYLSDAFSNTVMESSKKLSESLNSLWHRVRDKVQSLSVIEEGAPEHPKGEETNLQEKGHKSQRPVSVVQKVACKPLQPFTPSREVLEAERQNEARTQSLRKESMEAKAKAAEQNKKGTALAQEIKAAYEDQYGPITIDHRQGSGLAHIDRLAEQIKAAKLQAERTAIQDMIAQADSVYRDVKRTNSEVSAKLNSIKARIELTTSDLLPPPAAERLTADLRSIFPAVKDTAASKKTSKEVSPVPVSQPDSTPSQVSQTTSPSLFKVLAYDSSTLQMTIAETTSSLSAMGETDSQPLHPTEVLSRLNNVAKFLPYFAQMENQGYEIVSGSGDVLVFKKVRSPASPPDATTTADTTTQKLPTATPEERTPAESVMESIAPNASTSGAKVRRQESVFSGSGKSWYQDDPGNSGGGPSGKSSSSESGGFGRTLRRVLVAGTLTAVGAYGIGVAAEEMGAKVQEPQGRKGMKRMGRPGIYSTEDSR